jgi:hypothetical protein
MVLICSSQIKGTGSINEFSRDQTSLIFIKGLAETKLLEFAEQQRQDGDSSWETYVVKPGGVLSKSWSWIMTTIFGNAALIHIDVLAKAMLETALKGDAERRIFHAALVKKGKAALQVAK